MMALPWKLISLLAFQALNSFNRKSLSWMGLTRKRWCCIKDLGSRLDLNTCQTSIPSRARSLRNLLVSGNECGRVFPAGVGPGSPSRDAANWLPSRFSLSVETRRRYGWLRMMVFPGARLFPSPNLVPFGRVAARERQGALSRRAW